MQTLTGHTGPVYGVAFNPQGDRLASASLDGTIKIWQSDSGRELYTLPHSRSGWATGVAFNSTGAWLASAGADGRVIIWDAATGRQRLSLSGAGAVNGLAVAAGGNVTELLAAACADGQIRLWQLDGSQATALPPLARQQGPIYGVAVNPAGSQLATSGSDGVVKIWQINPAQSRLVSTLSPTTAAGALYAVAFSPDGKSLAAAGADGAVTIWKTTTPLSAQGGGEAQLRLTGHTAPVYALAFNPASDRLASAGEDGDLRVWDTGSGEEITVLSPPAAEGEENKTPIYALAFHPDGALVAAAGRNGLVSLWDIASGEPVASLPGTGVPVRALAFFQGSTGPLLAIGGDDGSVRLWAVRQSVRALPGAGAAVQALALSRDQLRLAATAADGTVTVWSLVSGQALWRLPSPPGVKAGFGLAFLPDGNLVTGSQAASAADMAGAALRWNIAADELLNLYNPAPLKGLALATPAGERLAAIGADGQVRLWQIASGQGSWSATAFGNRVFGVAGRVVLTSASAAGAYLAAGDDAGTVRLWEVESGRLLATLAAHTGPVNSLLLVSDSAGSRLITAGQDDTAKVWVISASGAIAGRPQLTLRGHSGDVVALALNPKGLLATASHDGTARLWDLADAGRELLTLSGHTGWLNDLAFNASGELLATAGEDGGVRVWEAASGRERLRLAWPGGRPGPVKHVVFAGTDRLAALAGDGSVVVWALGPGQNGSQPLLQLAPSTEGQTVSLAFDATGQALITAGAGGVVRFYALEAEDLLHLR